MHKTILSPGNLGDMGHIIRCILLSVPLTMVSGGTSEVCFPFPNVTTRLCSDVGIDTIIDDHEAVGGTPPLMYKISQNSTFVQVDEEYGMVTLNHGLAETNLTSLVLYKRVIDGRGVSADMVINMSIVRAIIKAKACPKILELHIREIAPVGEEVGLVQCTSIIPDHTEHSLDTPLFVSSQGVSSTNIPFNITPHGVVVVSQPLVYRNNIHDINIVNVTMVFLEGDGDPTTNCNRSETKITVKVIVEKSECDSNWTYVMKENVHLTLTPVITMSQSEPEDCMAVCNNNETFLCHGFNYNVIKKECLFLNETEYTQPNTTRKRLGMLLYRKYCKTEVFPLAILRNVGNKVENGSTFNTSFSADILGELLHGLTGTANMSTRDVVLASDIFLQVVNKSEIGKTSRHHLETYLQICGNIFDFLLSKTKNAESELKMKMHRILTTFDILIQSLSQNADNEWDTLNIASQMASFIVQRISLDKGQDHSAVTLYPGRSGLCFNFSSENLTDRLNSTILVAGTIDGLENVVTPTLANGLADNASLIVKGQMLAVVMEPLPRDPFEIQLDISTNGDEKTESSESGICAFLQKDLYRYSVWGTDGCWLVKYNTSHTRCRCSHLTNFAILMQVRQFQLEEIHVASLEVLTVIGCCLSIAALSTTVAVLLWFRLRSERYILLLHLSVAVVLAQVVFLAGIDAVQVRVVCRFVAILLHYLYLSVFTLMLAEGIHLFHKLHRAFGADGNLNMLLFLGWGSPFLIVSLSVLTDGDGYSSQQNCWLSTEGTIWAFVGPALTIIAINMAILVMIIRTYLGVTIVAKQTDIQKFKSSLKATVVLLPLLGITWMFGVVAVNENTVVFQYIFAILNSLQGLFIFLFHVVFNEDVRKACSKYKRNQVTCVDTLPRTSSVKKLHKKANRYSMTTSM